MRTLNLSTGNFDQVNTFRVALPRRKNGTLPLAKTCSLKKFDGQFEAVSYGACIKSQYSAADIAERDRLAAEAPLADGDTVQIEGAAYRFILRGDYSDCGYFVAI